MRWALALAASAVVLAALLPLGITSVARHADAESVAPHLDAPAEPAEPVLGLRGYDAAAESDAGRDGDPLELPSPLLCVLPPDVTIEAAPAGLLSRLTEFKLAAVRIEPGVWTLRRPMLPPPNPLPPPQHREWTEPMVRALEKLGPEARQALASGAWTVLTPAKDELMEAMIPAAASGCVEAFWDKALAIAGVMEAYPTVLYYPFGTGRPERVVAEFRVVDGPGHYPGRPMQPNADGVTLTVLGDQIRAYWEKERPGVYRYAEPGTWGPDVTWLGHLSREDIPALGDIRALPAGAGKMRLAELSGMRLSEFLRHASEALDVRLDVSDGVKDETLFASGGETTWRAAVECVATSAYLRVTRTTEPGVFRVGASPDGPYELRGRALWLAYDAEDPGLTARLLALLPGVMDRAELAQTPGWASWPREPWAGPVGQVAPDALAAVRAQLEALGQEWIELPESEARLRMTYWIRIAACVPYGVANRVTGELREFEPGSDLFDKYGFSRESPVYAGVEGHVEFH